MENAVIYARVSTQGQDYDRQVEELRAYAQRNDYQIVAEFTEKISGAKKVDERNAMTEMLDFVVDVKTCNAHDSKKTNSSAEKVSDRHALQLSENEEALFNELHKHTDNIIIIINSGNIFECSKFENDDKVKAILWIGNPGAFGAKSVYKN